MSKFTFLDCINVNHYSQAGKIPTDNVSIVNAYAKLRKLRATTFYKYPEYENLTVEELLREYHLPDQTDARKSWLQEEIFLKMFFFLPYLLQKWYNMKADMFNDAIQYMSMSVITAIKTYNPEYNKNFSNYLIGFFRSATAKTFRDRNIVSVKKTRRMFLQEAFSPTDNYATDDETAAQLLNRDISIDTILYSRTIEMNDGAAYQFSMENRPPDVDEEVYRRQISDMLEVALCEDLNVLTPDERRVLILHFGLFGAQPRVYKDIGELRKGDGKGSASSRISQINKQALKKLRAWFRSNKVASPF